MFDYELQKSGVTIPRSIFKLPADLAALYCYLLHKATYKPRFDKRITDNLDTGQVVITCSYMAKHFKPMKWSVHKIGRMVKRLASAELLQSECRATAKEGLLITICNYKELQTISNYGRRESAEQAQTKRRASADNINLETNKLINSERKDSTSPDKPVPSPSDNGAPPYDAIKDIYNKRVKKARQEGKIFQNPKNQQWPLPPIRSMTPARKTSIKARWKECSDKNEWEKIINAVLADDFWTGRNGKWYGAGFDNILRPGHFAKFRDRAGDNGDNPDGDGIVHTQQGRYNQGILKNSIEVIELKR